jgi:DNA ligase-4
MMWPVFLSMNFGMLNCMKIEDLSSLPSICFCLGRDVFCVLTGEYTLRARNIASMNQHNIARVDWLLRSIAAHELLPWTPADLFHATPTVKDQLSAEYDEFGDSYTQPLTKESLTYVLEKAALSVGSTVISV